jgi:hypothetical protein
MAQDPNSEAQGVNTDKAEEKLQKTEKAGLKETVTINAGYYAELMAYEAVEDSADEIVNQIKTAIGQEKIGDPLIILGKTDLVDGAALLTLLKMRLEDSKNVLNSAIKKYDDAKKKAKKRVKAKAKKKVQEEEMVEALPLPEIVSAAPVIMCLVESIAEFFNTNNTITARAVTIKEQALIAAVANKLKTEKFSEIILPQRSLQFQDRGLFKEIKELMQKREELLKFKAENNLGHANSCIDDEIKAAAKLIATFNEKIAEFALIEQIQQKSNARLLYLRTVSQGGEIEKTQSRIFGGRVTYIGGVIISYVLTDAEGKYLHSGNVRKIRNATYRLPAWYNIARNSYKWEIQESAFCDVDQKGQSQPRDNVG